MAGTNGHHPPELREAIRRRAAELFQRGGRLEEHDMENWCRAEAEILRESASHSIRRDIVVNIQGVVYTGEYESASVGDYTTGEWEWGSPVPVRFAGDKLFLRRPNGCELQTTIVKRIG